MATFRPGKPHSLRRLSANLAQAASPQRVVWSAIESEGLWGGGTTSQTLEIALTGLYLATYSLGHTAGTGAQSQALELRVDGSARSLAQSASSAGRIGTSGAWQDRLEAGQTIELWATNLALTGGKLIDAGISSLEVTRIGPKRWT